ncbi:MAG: chitobiase/beta-hexosaminidase C-terminal domain-containing protein, partial [Bacteroidales bacterium]
MIIKILQYIWIQEDTPYSPEISISRNFKIVLPVVSPPFFTPAGGTYYAAQSVSIGSATEHAVIYYTLDGTQPTSGSLLYTEAITVNSNIQIRAIACHASMEESSIVSANYVIRDTNAFIELPFDLSDNSTTERLDITLINGVYSVHLGSSYADGGAKFETAAAGAATLTIKMNTVPDKLWFDLRGRIGGSSPQAYSGIRFNILQSSDGQQWNTLASLTEQDIPIENYETFPEYQIDRATRFIKWHLVEASKGNTQLNNIKISKYEAVPED